MKSSSFRTLPLTDSEVERYWETGVLFPIQVLSPEEQRRFRGEIDELEALLFPSRQPQLFGECHLSFRWAYELSKHTRVLDVVERLIGPDILVHSSTIFSKPPGRRFVSWHQDGSYWRLSKPRLVSAWIALSDSTIENGCLRVQPGTHLKNLEHVAIHHDDNMLATGNTVAKGYDEALAVDVVLNAGELSLHHANLLHGSNPNRSEANRVGFAIRYVAPEVRQGRGHQTVLLVRGQDRYNHFEKLEHPPVHSVREGLPFHLASTERLTRRDLDQFETG